MKPLHDDSGAAFFVPSSWPFHWDTPQNLGTAATIRQRVMRKIWLIGINKESVGTRLKNKCRSTHHKIPFNIHLSCTFALHKFGDGTSLLSYQPPPWWPISRHPTMFEEQALDFLASTSSKETWTCLLFKTNFYCIIGDLKVVASCAAHQGHLIVANWLRNWLQWTPIGSYIWLYMRFMIVVFVPWWLDTRMQHCDV